MKALRINFDKQVRMHLACSDEEIRPVLSHIFFSDGFAYASDAYVLVKNYIAECSTLPHDQIKLLDGKLLHKAHYRDLLGYDAIEISEEGIEARKGKKKAFFYFNDDASLTYPNAEKTIRDILNLPDKPVTQIGVGLSLVEKLRTSLFDSSVCAFRFKGETAAIVVHAIVVQSRQEATRSMGIILPNHLETATL